jgi:hypothetical protein
LNRTLPLSRLLTHALLPALLVYSAALLLSRAGGITDPELVIRDLGYLLWMATAAICLFVALAGGPEASGRLRPLLLSGGLFSLLLCLDDMFLLHDRYIGATFLYLLYAVFAVLILVRFRSQVLEIGGALFVIPVALLGGSILLDKLQNVLPFSYNEVQLVEEGLKFLGIAGWLFFWWQAAARAAKLRTSA